MLSKNQKNKPTQIWYSYEIANTDFYSCTEDSNDFTGLNQLQIVGQCLRTQSLNLLITELFRRLQEVISKNLKILKQGFSHLIKTTETFKVFPFQSKLNQEYAELLYL